MWTNDKKRKIHQTVTNPRTPTNAQTINNTNVKHFPLQQLKATSEQLHTFTLP